MNDSEEPSVQITRRQLLLSSAASTVGAAGLGTLLPAPSYAASVLQSKVSVDVAGLETPVLLCGDETHAYRDPAAVYHNGQFHLFYTYNPPPDADGKVYWFTAVSKSRDLRQWTEPRLLTPKDQTLNFSSPGNVIRFRDGWVLCLQTVVPFAE